MPFWKSYLKQTNKKRPFQNSFQSREMVFSSLFGKNCLYTGYNHQFLRKTTQIRGTINEKRQKEAFVGVRWVKIDEKRLSATGENQKLAKISFPSRGKIKKQRKTTFPHGGKQEISGKQISLTGENQKTAKTRFPSRGKIKKQRRTAFPHGGNRKNSES